jgi:uncharacterized repeat protein (TIGR03803 family)
MDQAGFLYGMTENGGVPPYSGGTVFMVEPSGNETVLHSFGQNPGEHDGSSPRGGLIMDQAGNLYGTACCAGLYGYGMVFEIDSSGNYYDLYDFKNSGDGGSPMVGLTIDPAGNLYGTAYSVIFELDTSGNFTVLQSSGSDSALLIDPAGNLFGTSVGSGSSTVFKRDIYGNYTTLYTFNPGSDGWGPFGRLIMDAAGNLYGTAAYGGIGSSQKCSSYGCGTVFVLDTYGNYTVLHSFAGDDGANPFCGLVMDAAGNLYGTTRGGGSYGYGTVFEIDSSGNYTVLYNFTGGSDGANPYAGVITDGNGNLYGTTFVGGAGYGTVFQLQLPSMSARPRRPR